MRITGGSCARQILKVPKGLDLRPTPDRVRQAIFNSLGDRILGTEILELFAGSGALSLESLSRGAQHALCVELSQHHADFIRRNAESVGYGTDRLATRVQDVFSALQQLSMRAETYDLIMADPPYGEKNTGRRSTSFAQKLIDSADLPKVLRPGGLVILGHAKRDAIEIPPSWRELKVLSHGDNIIRVLEIATV